MPGINASAHLQSFGWAGPGHPLNPGAYKQKGSRGLAYDPSSTQNNNSNSSSYFAAGGNGLIRPLLVSKKSDNLGLGRRAHEPQKGTEWWLKGFEAALASTGTTNSSRDSTPPVGKKAEDLQRTVNVQAGRFGGLYGFFVRGETVGGTIGDTDEDEDNSDEEEDETATRGRGTGRAKRRSDVLDSSPSADNSKSKTTKAKTKKRRKKDADADIDMTPAEEAEASFGQIAAFMSVRDKDAKKRAETKRLRESEQFRVAGEWLEIKETGKSTIRKKKNGVTTNGMVDDEDSGAKKDKKARRMVVDEDGEERPETKEERRLRRERRRERRAEKG